MAEQTLSVSLKQVPQGRLGVWLLIVGELIIFGGLVVCYLLYRLRFPSWVEQTQHTSTFYGGLNTFVLLTSSYTIVKANDAALKKDLVKMSRYMLTTIFCGLIFLAVKSTEYAHEIGAGFTLTSPGLQATNPVGATFWSFYYIMTGLHATHVLAGMVTLFFVWLDARKGRNIHRVELGGLYWHMVDLIWIFLFPLLYIAK